MLLGSRGDYQADEQAGVEQLRWRLSGRRAGRCRAAQMETIKPMSRKVSRGSSGDYQADEQASVARLSDDYQADDQAGVTRLSWPQSSRRAGRCRAVQFSIIRQMNRQGSS